jgi:micrococcal nuclease
MCPEVRAVAWLTVAALLGCEPLEQAPPPPRPTVPSIPDAPKPKPKPKPKPETEPKPKSAPVASTATDDTPALSATLVSVTDGDTIVVKLDGKRERVRLIGIDTPETANSPRGPQPFADEATAALKRHLGRGRVELRFDAEERDHYGRLLAYVYAADGTFANEALVREGWARALRVPPNVRHAKHFESLARAARRERRGMWAAG